jgi:hypothetical protein
MNMTNYNLKKTEYCEEETLENLLLNIWDHLYDYNYNSDEDGNACALDHLKTYIDNLIRQRNDEMTANFKIS